MNTASWVSFALIVVPCVASAQGVNCPVRNAPMPMMPPGKPPEFLPKVTLPSTFKGELRMETGVTLPPDEDLVDAEEGHVTAIARSAESARLVPPPADVLRELVDTRKTLLSEWRFDGYLPEMPRHKVPRVFSRNGSVLIFEQWNMAADGASVVTTPPQTVKIGRFLGNTGGLRSPSGCIGASLTWNADGVSYSLRMAGQESLQQQRDLLVAVARSIESVTPSLSR
jgi:hypothetical protein